MKASVFVGVSVDGFIARLDGVLDFLPENGGEPHGYHEFLTGVDTIVIGRKTFETVLAMHEWPYEDKRVVVLSTSSLESGRAAVERMSGPPGEIVVRLEATGTKHAYIDGGITIQQFLRAGFVQRMTITRIPILIGEGVPLFGSLPHDLRLRHIATQSYASGLVKSEYEVLL